MSYVIYIIKSTQLVNSRRYKSVAAAKAAITRGERLGLIDRDLVAIEETSKFHSEIEGRVLRVNLMTGKEYYEPVNTPRYCSPSSEAYWSM